ncbi:hypothetical protein JCM6882_004908 [Rhodosporidiobolus microsporus]
MAYHPNHPLLRLHAGNPYSSALQPNASVPQQQDSLAQLQGEIQTTQQELAAVPLPYRAERRRLTDVLEVLREREREVEAQEAFLEREFEEVREKTSEAGRQYNNTVVNAVSNPVHRQALVNLAWQVGSARQKRKDLAIELQIAGRGRAQHAKREREQAAVEAELEYLYQQAEEMLFPGGHRSPAERRKVEEILATLRRARRVYEVVKIANEATLAEIQQERGYLQNGFPQPQTPEPRSVVSRITSTLRSSSHSNAGGSRWLHEMGRAGPPVGLRTARRYYGAQY